MQAKDLKDWPVLSSIDTSNIRKAFVFANTAVILENDGTLFGFGRNDNYLLGNNSESTNYSRIAVSSTKFKDFTTNGEHGLAMSEEGFLYSWGSNKHGQLGRVGDCHPVSLATKVFAVKIKEAACGTGFSCVLTQDGRAYEWGINGYNEIKLDSHCKSDQLNEVSEKEKIISIQGTKCYPVILTETGKVFIPSFPQATNKCNLCLHCKKMNALEGPMKNKNIIQVLSGKRYAFALSSSGEIFLWTLCHGIADDPEQLSVRIGRVVKLWASSSHDVLIAANNLGNLYSITWSECGILLSVTQINFPSAGKYFAKLKMQMQGPVYDQGTFNCDLEKSTDVLNEWRGRFEAAFNRKEDSDVSFLVGGGYIYAHRAILSIQSSYLNAILKNDWKENSDNNQVTIKEFTYPTYLRFMRFLYTGKLELSSHDGNLELLKLAHEYVEKSLLDLCKNMVIQGLTTENAFSTYNVANTLGLEDVRQASKNFIGKNLEDVILSDDISNQDKDLLLRNVRDMVCSKTIIGEKMSTAKGALTAKIHRRERSKIIQGGGDSMNFMIFPGRKQK